MCVFGETLNTNQKVSFPNISGLLPIKRAHSKHIKQGIKGLETPFIGIKPAGTRRDKTKIDSMNTPTLINIITP